MESKKECREFFSSSLKKGNKDKMKMIALLRKRTIGAVLDEAIESEYNNITSNK